MGITARPKRGGLLENLAGRKRHLILRNAEIERFEDAHGGIFDLWHAFLGEGPRPTSTQVRDLITLGLTGAGMDEEKAAALVADLGPDKDLYLYAIGQSLLAVAFLPDSVDGGGDPSDESDGGDEETGKKT